MYEVPLITMIYLEFIRPDKIRLKVRATLFQKFISNPISKRFDQLLGFLMIKKTTKIFFFKYRQSLLGSHTVILSSLAFVQSADCSTRAPPEWQSSLFSPFSLNTYTCSST
jgi:hypothetical protein